MGGRRGGGGIAAAHSRDNLEAKAADLRIGATRREPSDLCAVAAHPEPDHVGGERGERLGHPSPGAVRNAGPPADPGWRRIRGILGSPGWDQKRGERLLVPRISFKAPSSRFFRRQMGQPAPFLPQSLTSHPHSGPILTSLFLPLRPGLSLLFLPLFS